MLCKTKAYKFRHGYSSDVIHSVPPLFTQEAVVWRFSVKKMFLEISQNSQENTCVRVSF